MEDKTMEGGYGREQWKKAKGENSEKAMKRSNG